MIEPVTELNDIQAILRTGFGSLDEACYLLLRVTDAGLARAWLAAIAGPATGAGRVTTVADLQDRQTEALQIAFSGPGLRAFGLDVDIVAQFAREFRLGIGSPAAEAQGVARRLGDVGPNAAAHWAWGSGDNVPDAMLLLYSVAGGLAVFAGQVKAAMRGVSVMAELPASLKRDRAGERLEHFGFMDGISQPELDWEGRRNPGAGGLSYRNRVAAGEFLLGYPNEYGLFTDRPLLPPGRDPLALLAPAKDDPSLRDFARNGSYLVWRQLEQDVAAFWRFLAANDPAGLGVELAELMVGRRRGGGAPLAMPAAQPIEGAGTSETELRRNGFTFVSDPDGLACPLGAHIRRANPRTADMPGGEQSLLSQGLRMLGLKSGGPREDLVSAARFHRIIRRGRTYGGFLPREQALRADESGPRGLHFMALNADISRQFEFIQNAWLMNPSFDGLYGEADPLLGNRVEFPAGRSTGSYSLPLAAGPCRRLELPRFVTVRGGAYFFLPGLRALRFLATC